MNASACGAMVKDYGHHLAHDPAYAEKAQRVSALTRDLSELLPQWVPLLKDRVQPSAAPLVYHPPCTLQHGQKLRGGVEQHLGALGFKLRLAQKESHLCCGSAGTYSVLQSSLSLRLRERKLEGLNASAQETIVTANIGCMTHLQAGTDVAVRHWVEVLDEALHAR
jgi:glycolate oxidase iron-sulfur subunit